MSLKKLKRAAVFMLGFSMAFSSAACTSKNKDKNTPSPSPSPTPDSQKPNISGGTEANGLSTGDGTYANRPITLRQMEYLDRAPVAVLTENGTFISWRFLGTDAQDTVFDIYKNGVKIAHITGATNYLDSFADINSKYQIKAYVNEKEIDVTAEFMPLANNYLEIPVGNMEGYALNEISVGDLDGDGAYEFVLLRIPANYWADDYKKSTIFPLFQAYKMDGTLLWTIDLGPNVADIHDLNFLVADLTGDGKAEVVIKTADLTKDGTGKVIEETVGGGKDYRYSYTANANRQYLKEGPEFLSVFDGMTGAELARTNYIERGNVSQWGSAGMAETPLHHRANKFLMSVAYLNGVSPSIVIGRGIWETVKLEAFNFTPENGLEKLWHFTSQDYPDFWGAGFHSMSIADVNFDGLDEIMYGSALIGPDGKPMNATGQGHGDALHLGKFLYDDQDNYQVVRVYEGIVETGLEIRDAKTGELIFGVPNQTDAARAIVADIDPRYDGPVIAGGGGTGYYVYHEGKWIPWENPPAGFPMNFRIHWTGDLYEELSDGQYIYRYNAETNKLDVMLYAAGTASLNGTKKTPALQADILGDWREEYALPTADNSAIRIYTTTDPTDFRIYTLMHDPVYRMSTIWQNNHYAQPPHVGFYFGSHTTEVPLPEIFIKKDGKIITNPDLDGKAPTETKVEIFKPNIPDTLIMLKDSSYVLADGKLIDFGSLSPIVSNGETLIPSEFATNVFDIKSTSAKTVDGIQCIVLEELCMILGKNSYQDTDGLIIISGQKIAALTNTSDLIKKLNPNAAQGAFTPKEVTDSDGKKLLVVFEQDFNDYQAGSNADWAGGIPAPLETIEVGKSLMGYSGQVLRLSGAAVKGNRNAMISLSEAIGGKVRIQFDWNVGTITGGLSNGQFRLADSEGNIIIGLSARPNDELKYAAGGQINIAAASDTFEKQWKDVGTGLTAADKWYSVIVDIDFNAKTLTLTVDDGANKHIVSNIAFEGCVDFKTIEVAGIRVNNNYTWNSEVGAIRVAKILN